MKQKFFGLALPGFILSIIVGVIVGFVIFFFKLAIDYALRLNALIYQTLDNYKYLIPILILIILGISFAQSKIIKEYLLLRVEVFLQVKVL